MTVPGSPSVLVNMMIGIEQHVDWITACILHLGRAGATSIDPTPDVEESWVAHVPGKPRVFTPYVGGIGHYRKKCGEVAAHGYERFAIPKAPSVV